MKKGYGVNFVFVCIVLLSVSFASAGFFDWFSGDAPITGNVISEQIIFEKNDIYLDAKKGPWKHASSSGSGDAIDPLLISSVSEGQIVLVSGRDGSYSYSSSSYWKVECDYTTLSSRFYSENGLYLGFYNDKELVSEYELREFVDGITVPNGAISVYAYIKEADQWKNGYADNKDGCTFDVKVTEMVDDGAASSSGCPLGLCKPDHNGVDTAYASFVLDSGILDLNDNGYLDSADTSVLKGQHESTLNVDDSSSSSDSYKDRVHYIVDNKVLDFDNNGIVDDSELDLIKDFALSWQTVEGAFAHVYGFPSHTGDTVAYLTTLENLNAFDLNRNGGLSSTDSTLFQRGIDYLEAISQGQSIASISLNEYLIDRFVVGVYDFDNDDITDEFDLVLYNAIRTRTGVSVEDAVALAYTTVTCTDGDGGIDYYDKGNTTFSNGGRFVEFCTGDDLDFVVEYSCNSEGNDVNTDIFECPLGCFDGACIIVDNPIIIDDTLDLNGDGEIDNFDVEILKNRNYYNDASQLEAFVRSNPCAVFTPCDSIRLLVDFNGDGKSDSGDQIFLRRADLFILASEESFNEFMMKIYRLYEYYRTTDNYILPYRSDNMTLYIITLRDLGLLDSNLNGRIDGIDSANIISIIDGVYDYLSPSQEEKLRYYFDNDVYDIDNDGYTDSLDNFVLSGLIVRLSIEEIVSYLEYSSETKDDVGIDNYINYVSLTTYNIRYDTLHKQILGITLDNSEFRSITHRTNFLRWYSEGLFDFNKDGITEDSTDLQVYGGADIGIYAEPYVELINEVMPTHDGDVATYVQNLKETTAWNLTRAYVSSPNDIAVMIDVVNNNGESISEYSLSSVARKAKILAWKDSGVYDFNNDAVTNASDSAFYGRVVLGVMIDEAYELSYVDGEILILPEEVPIDPQCQSQYSCTVDPIVCPSNGVQVESCVDVSDCGRFNITSTRSCNPGVCSGCLLADSETCVPTGFRTIEDISGVATNVFCSIDRSFSSQVAVDDVCQNNFECSSNQCSNGLCVGLVEEIRAQTSILNKIICALTNLFNPTEFAACLAE
ncbi:MAG: hypothetical protein ACI83O_000766 [Patescibacteria group bacterium]|jgi:hypothetical protein